MFKANSLLISFKLTSYLGLWLEIPFLCQDCFLQPFLPVWEEHEDIIMETRRSLRLDQKRKDQKPTHQGESTQFFVQWIFWNSRKLFFHVTKWKTIKIWKYCFFIGWHTNLDWFLHYCIRWKRYFKLGSSLIRNTMFYFELSILNWFWPQFLKQPQ